MIIIINFRFKLNLIPKIYIHFTKTYLLILMLNKIIKNVQILFSEHS